MISCSIVLKKEKFESEFYKLLKFYLIERIYPSNNNFYEKEYTIPQKRSN